MDKFCDKKILKMEKFLTINDKAIKFLTSWNFDGVDEYVKNAVYSICNGNSVNIIIGENLTYQSLKILAITKQLCENSLHCYNSEKSLNGFNTKAIAKNLMFVNGYTNSSNNENFKNLEKDNNKFVNSKKINASFLPKKELTTTDLYDMAITKEIETKQSEINKSNEIKSL